MAEDQSRIDANFFQLVVSLQMAALQNMGKIASPMTGEVDRNMEQAKISVEMLVMISEKTKGNLTDEEKNLLDRALYELRMNYVDETKKDESKPEEKKEAVEADKSESEPVKDDVADSEKSD